MPKSLGCAKSFLIISITALYLCEVNVHVCIQAYVVKKPGRQLIRNTAVYTRKTGQSLLEPDFSHWIDSDSNGIKITKSNQVHHKKEFHQKEENLQTNRANVKVLSNGLRRSPQIGRQSAVSKGDASKATVIKEVNQIKNNAQTNRPNVKALGNGLRRSPQLGRQGSDAPAAPVLKDASPTNIYDKYIVQLMGYVEKYLVPAMVYVTDLPEAFKKVIRQMIETIFGTPPEKMDTIERKILSKIEDFKNKTKPIPERVMVMVERIVGVRNFRQWLNKIERLSNTTVDWLLKEVISKPEQIRDTIFRILRVKNTAEMEKEIEKRILSVINWINKDLINFPDRVLQFIHKTLGTPAEKIIYVEKLTRRLIDWIIKEIIPVPEQIIAAIDRVFNESLYKSIQDMWDSFMKSFGRFLDLPSRLLEPILGVFPGAQCIGDVIRILMKKSWIESLIGGIRGALNRYELVRYFVKKIKDWFRQKRVWNFIRNKIFRPTVKPIVIKLPAFKPDSIVGAFGMPCDGKYSSALPLHPFDKKMASIIGSYIYDLTHRSADVMEDGLPSSLNAVISQARSKIANDE